MLWWRVTSDDSCSRRGDLPHARSRDCSKIGSLVKMSTLTGPGVTA